MKILSAFALFLGLLSAPLLQAQDSLRPLSPANDSLMRAALLQELARQHSANNENSAKQLKDLETRIASLDVQLQSEKNDKKRVENLQERVQLLEKKEETLSERTVSAYQHNYKSAFINLIEMGREIKPLVLFNASRDFFSQVNSVGNPMKYKGYDTWFKKFKAYMDKQKSIDAKLGVLDNLLSLAGDVGKGTLPLAGPLANSLLESIGSFINGLSKRDKELREESQKMFELTAVLSQFNHERSLIEGEWDEINKELDELQRLYADLLEKNLQLLDIARPQFDAAFTRQNDASKRFEYILSLTKVIAERINKERKSNPDKWKTVFFHQMESVQALKVRFGMLTFRMKENIHKYQKLISKYENCQVGEVKSEMIQLKTKLTALTNAFDATFDPQAYIKSAQTMYVVD